MKRRGFIKSMGALGLVSSVPSFFNDDYFIKKASAAPRILDANLDLSGFTGVQRLPQVINIFLYGGPSELAGNLTNIDDINMNSQNSYDAKLLAGDKSGVTSNDFWGNRVIDNNGDLADQGAGGYIMEDMLRTQDMSVYRTINRRKNNTRAHRLSVFSSQKGTLDIEMSGGVGSTLAGVLIENAGQLDGHSAIGNKTLNEMLLPFVSFEGTTAAYAPDANYTIQKTQFKGISLDTNFNNPFTRAEGVAAETGGGRLNVDADIDALVTKVAGSTASRFKKVNDAFINRKTLEDQLDNVSTIVMPNITAGDPDRGPNDEYVDVAGDLVYPNTNYTDRIRAAVSLAINNPDSLYITVGGGLGGWDDHNDAQNRYETRMSDLMDTIRAAMKQIRHSTRPGVHAAIPTDNIIINVHGDFGRNVNLNNSMGWDHGNNQNLYTFGGSAIRPGGINALGKIVGQTERFGDSGQNRQFTRPTSSSYEAEPMSIASTVYSYFGVSNPEVLTSDDTMNPSGDAAIDESQAVAATITADPQTPV